MAQRGPRKVFKNLDTVMAILELSEQFLWQILFNFLPLTLNPSPNMTHFVRTLWGAVWKNIIYFVTPLF